MNELIYPEISISVLPLSSVLRARLQINEFEAEVDINIEGDRAIIKYPKNWVLYSQSLKTEWDDEPISYEELIEEAEQYIPGVVVYISRASEKEIYLKIQSQILHLLKENSCPIISQVGESWISKFKV